MAHKNQYSQVVVDAVLNAVRGGMSRYAAAKKYGVSQPLVLTWCKRAGMEFSYSRVNTSMGVTKTLIVVEVEKCTLM